MENRKQEFETGAVNTQAKKALTMQLLQPASLDTPPHDKVAIDPLLLSLLCCPSCVDRPALKVVPGSTEKVEASLFCASCGRVYSIKNGVPYLLIEDFLIKENSDKRPGSDVAS